MLLNVVNQKDPFLLLCELFGDVFVLMGLTRSGAGKEGEGKRKRVKSAWICRGLEGSFVFTVRVVGNSHDRRTTSSKCRAAGTFNISCSVK